MSTGPSLSWKEYYALIDSRTDAEKRAFEAERAGESVGAELSALRAKLEAARKAITAADHAVDCGEEYRGYPKCTCWKAAALREIGEGV